MNTISRIFIILGIILFVSLSTPIALADQLTATSCTTTNVGTPLGKPQPLPSECNSGASGTTGYALKLVLAVTNEGKNCAETDRPVNGYGLPSTNYNVRNFRRIVAGSTCLDAIDPVANNYGLTDWSVIKNDGQYLQDRPGGYLQCVGFANAVLRGANKVALVPEQNAVAYAYHTADYPDYTWIQNKIDGSNNDKLKPGDAVIFSGGDFGHIAIVVQVPDKKTNPMNFIVAEGNGDGMGEVDLMSYNTAIAGYGFLNLVGWYHKK